MRWSQKLLAVSGILVFCVSDAAGQSGFVSFMLRPRFEVQYGYRVPPDTNSVPQVLTTQRSRINAGYKSDRLEAYVSFQDVRTWGEQVLQSVSTSRLVQSLYEGWFQYHFTKNLSVKAGRQELKFDNNRIIGHTDWNQQARSFDALLLTWSFAPNWTVHAAGCYNQERQTLFGNYYNLANPKTIQFLRVNKSHSDSLMNYSVSAMLLGDGYQTPDTSGVVTRWTPGFYASYKKGPWGLVLEGYLQRGKTRTVNQSGNIVPDSFQRVSAYMFSVNPSFDLTRNLRLTTGIDWLSGSDALDTSQAGTTRMFNNQYGNNHPFYGKIDLFFNLPADTRNGGLIDAYVMLTYLYKKWSIYLAYHYFQLNGIVEDAENRGQPLDKPLGSEIDLWAMKDITKDLSVNTGFSVFFPTRSMEFVKSTQFSQLGGPTITAYWFYLMITVRPTLFFKG